MVLDLEKHADVYVIFVLAAVLVEFVLDIGSTLLNNRSLTAGSSLRLTQ